jgi:hypothetical protein
MGCTDIAIIEQPALPAELTATLDLAALRKFPTYVPLAVAAIGLMPLPLLHRAIVINMQRAGGLALVRLDERSATFPATRVEIRKWAEICKLAPDPDMPPTLRNRAADNWRVLVAIADNLGHGEAARAAAVVLYANRPDEDAGVVLLTDIRNIFGRLAVDRISSAPDRGAARA